MNLDTTMNSSQCDFNSPIGSPVSAASNIRGKIKDIQKQLHSHNVGIEETNVELKRVRQMLDPLRLSMKRYTDNLEENMNKSLENMSESQGKENEKINGDIDQLKDENNRLKQTIFQMKQQMDTMATSIAQLQGQVFGNYDSDSDTIDKTTKKLANATTRPAGDRQ